ncbi:MAG: lipoprotein [Anaerolineales bacterium]
MRTITVWDKLRYQFDNTMSKGTIALMAWLGLITLILIVLTAIILVITHANAPDGAQYTFGEAMWQSLIRALDSGAVGGDVGWGRLIFLGMTIGGIFILSILIGVITSGIESRLEDLRKGRSFVVENDHTIILGWSPQVFSIISELVIANENQKDSCIVILAEQDKVEMEDEIRDKVEKTGKTRIVCRTGSPIDLSDLEIVNPHTARAIIIPSPPLEDPDTYVIKSVLAITNNPHRRPEPYHIVAEIRDMSNLEVARLVGGEEAQLVLADDLIARITVQASLQSGLSVVYTELLDFGGDEIYFHEEPGLVGKTFGEASFAYEDSVLLGVRQKDGKVLLNPPMETHLQAGDKLIIISQDDDTIHLSEKTGEVDETVLMDTDQITMISARTLILGWNHRATTIVNELDAYLHTGSKVTVVADTVEARSIIAAECGQMEHANLEVVHGDITSRKLLDSLNVPSYHHIIILSYSDTLPAQQADARTLITLLHLRDIANQHKAEFTITTEMLEVQNRDLAAVTRADDFIVSNKLISLMLSQISENKELTAVFQDLFDPEGSELYLKPINDYIEVGRPVNFYTLVEAARRRGQVAVGYRLQAESREAEKMYGVHVNPKKSEKVKFTEEDKLIVLAEN